MVPAFVIKSLSYKSFCIRYSKSQTAVQQVVISFSKRHACLYTCSLHQSQKGYLHLDPVESVHMIFYLPDVINLNDFNLSIQGRHCRADPLHSLQSYHDTSTIYHLHFLHLILELLPLGYLDERSRFVEIHAVNWSICSPPCLCTLRKSHHSCHNIFRSHVYARCSYPREQYTENLSSSAPYTIGSLVAHFSIIRLLIVPLVPPSQIRHNKVTYSMVLLLCLYINSVGIVKAFGKYQVLKN